METKITYWGLNKDIDINNEPELVIIKEHLTEYYTDKDIRIYPYKHSNNIKITATFYINSKAVVSTSIFSHAWVGRVRCKKELVSKLKLIGIDII